MLLRVESAIKPQSTYQPIYHLDAAVTVLPSFFFSYKP